MRYLPHTPKEIEKMLQTIGVGDREELFASIPESVRLKKNLDLPASLSEIELRNHLRDLSRENLYGEDWACFLGGGSYSHTIPSAVSPLLGRGEFLTAYTPYQPEVSQGTLQAIYEYQTMVSEILGMEIANASNYDGSTATAEAVLMAMRINRKRNKILIGRSVHPEYRAVVNTYLQNQGVEIVEIPFTKEGILDRKQLVQLLDDQVCCVVAATPNFFGVFDDVSDISKLAHEKGALMITTSSEPLAFGLFLSPGEMDADIAVAEGQSFGNAMSFGGPYLGLFATRSKYARALPGRIVGETVDTKGRRGFVLTLATREQHIRRERATSNICTNVALCALAATMTLSLWGKGGFEKLAKLNYQAASSLKKRIETASHLKVTFSSTSFNEFVVSLPRDAETILKKLRSKKILAGLPLKKWYGDLENSLLICVTEMNTKNDIHRLLKELETP